MIRAIGVVIPVHDEAAHLGACLASVERALERLPAGMERAVAIVLDACTDDSEAIARRWARRAPADQRVCLSLDVCNVGHARGHGMTHVLAELNDFDPAEAWLATTDADTLVPEPWLSEQVRMAAEGVQAIAGTIDVHDWSDQPIGLDERFREFYEPAGSDDAHPHVHGANFGVRGDAYLAAGGFPPIATGEDHALWNALQLTERPRVSSRRLPVTTSARRIARAPGGFSHFLAQFAAVMVPGR